MRRFGVLVGASFVVLAGCSGGSPKVTTTSSASTSTAPASASAAACPPTSVSASVVFTKSGGSASSPAGAVLFRDTGATPCALRGVPDVQVVAPGGQTISTFEAPGPASVVAAAVLTPAAPQGTGAQAASSITFSSWTCTVGSFSFLIRFPSWTSSVAADATSVVTAPSATTTVPAPCTQTRETDQTVYISPVATVAG